jgi:hypothetical protein
MTTQQLRAKLDRAVAIIAECERAMEEPHRFADSWDAVGLKHRASDFMDLHRDELREGGQS